MDLAVAILGTTCARELQTRNKAAVLVVGSDVFTRADLAGVECFNFAAAKRVSDALSKLKVKNARDLFDRIPPERLAVPGVGTFSLAVLGAAFEAKGIGGAHPLVNWMREHDTALAGKGLVTFETLKQRVDRALEDPGARTKRKGAA